MSHIAEFTDGCASQYKSKKPFKDISESSVPMVRSLFGTRHGKGPSDGIAAVVKMSATRAVKSGRAVIDSPKSFYEFMEKEMTTHDHEHKKSHRKFMYVSSDEIERNSKDSECLVTIQGTHHLHCVASTGKPGEVKVRVLSCHCLDCKEEAKNCANIENVGPWQTVNLQQREPTCLPNLKERIQIFLEAKKTKTTKLVRPIHVSQGGGEFCFMSRGGRGQASCVQWVDSSEFTILEKRL